MDEIYEVEGQPYQVSSDRKAKFLLEFPDAVKVGEVEGEEVNVTVKAEQGETESVVVDQNESSIDFDATLPQATIEDVQLKERKAIPILYSKFGGLDFEFLQD